MRLSCSLQNAPLPRVTDSCFLWSQGFEVKAGSVHLHTDIIAFCLKKHTIFEHIPFDHLLHQRSTPHHDNLPSTTTVNTYAGATGKKDARLSAGDVPLGRESTDVGRKGPSAGDIGQCFFLKPKLKPQQIRFAVRPFGKSLQRDSGGTVVGGFLERSEVSVRSKAQAVHEMNPSRNALLTGSSVVSWNHAEMILLTAIVLTSAEEPHVVVHGPIGSLRSQDDDIRKWHGLRGGQ